MPNTAALTRWEFRLDVQTVPTCLKPIYLVTQECETEDSSGERLGRPGTFPGLVLMCGVNLQKTTLNGHLKTHPRQKIRTIFGRSGTKINGLVSLLLSQSESCKHFITME